MSGDRTIELLPPHPAHQACWACGDNPGGLNLRFADDGRMVSATFACQQRYAGYTDILQGGVAAAILDSAMTNCLFRRNLVALTAELTLRYRHPIHCGRRAEVRAWIKEQRGPLWLLEGEIRQDGQVKTKATGKFFRKP